MWDGQGFRLLQEFQLGHKVFLVNASVKLKIVLLLPSKVLCIQSSHFGNFTLLHSVHKLHLKFLQVLS